MASTSLACLPFVTGKNALVVYRPRLFNHLKTTAIIMIGLKIAWARGKKLPPSTVAPAAGEIRLSAPPVLKQQAAQPPEYDLEFNQQSGRARRRQAQIEFGWRVGRDTKKQRPQLRMRLEPLNFKSGSVLLFHTATV